MSLAAGYDLVLIDLDGVVYLGAEPVAGAPAAIQATVEGGTPVAYVTNNASRRAEEVAALLVSYGAPARSEDVLTAAKAAADVLAADLPADAPVLVVGAAALREEIASVGLRPLRSAEQSERRPAAVVQGYGPDVGWRDLAAASVAVRAGARWVVTNLDATLPSPHGPLPGNGSLVEAVRIALGGRGPDLVVGKPEPSLFQVAARRTGANRVLVVGDRLDTDIEGARRAGMDSLLVLTGVSGAPDVLRAASHHRPTYLAAGLEALIAPPAASMIPAWREDAVHVDGWLARQEEGRLVLGGGPADGESRELAAAAAVRALAAAAWAHPEWSAIAAAGAAAERTLAEVGLDRFEGRPIRAASAA